MTRTRHVVRRIGFALVTVVAAVVANFLIFRAAPGSPISALSLRPGSSPAYRQHLLHQAGLDRSLPQQFGDYVGNLLHGRLGVSIANQQLVSANLKTAFLNTLPLVALATVMALALGLVVGVGLAWMRSSRLEGPGLLTVLTTYSLPTQWIGLVLLFVFAGTLPSGGISDEFLVDPSFFTAVGDRLQHMILPATALALSIFGQYAFIVRSAMLEVLGEDFMLTARAKGLSSMRLLTRHALSNALLPIVSLTALIVGSISGGTILVEAVFSYPGIGRAISSAVSSRDYPMLQGAFLMLTILVVFFNLVADLLAVKLDPRVTE
ncbi:MAG TPA: ABC transporter permease [Conexibacter sp.]|nr:ABC transporter permease [Conexibacter sp.]